MGAGVIDAAAIALELRRLCALVADLAEDQQHTERRRLAADDRRIGIVLLPLAAELIGATRFSGPTLYGIALNDRTPIGQALREILADYGSMRALGKLLARLDGTTFAGCRLVPAGRIGGDRAWRIDRVCGD